MYIYIYTYREREREREREGEREKKIYIYIYIYIYGLWKHRGDKIMIVLMALVPLGSRPGKQALAERSSPSYCRRSGGERFCPPGVATRGLVRASRTTLRWSHLRAFCTRWGACGEPLAVGPEELKPQYSQQTWDDRFSCSCLLRLGRRSKRVGRQATVSWGLLLWGLAVWGAVYLFINWLIY